MKIAVGNIYSLQEIEGIQETLKIELSQRNKDLLMEGDTSELLDYLGKKSKIHLRRNEAGEVIIHVNHKKDTLEIPSKIEGHNLTEFQKRQLLQGETSLLKTSGGNLYLQIDKDLNRVIIRGDKAMNIPREVKGYQLSDGDKYLLANGKPMPPKVFKSDKGYILSTFSLTPDRKGVEFTNSISIKREDVKRMIAQYNTPTPMQLEPEIEKTRELDKAVKKESEKQNIENQIKTEVVEQPRPIKEEKIINRNLDEEFLDAFGKRDWETLNRLATQDNYQPSKQTLANAEKLHNLTDQDKAALKTIFPEKAKEPELNIIKNDGKTNVIVEEEKKDRGNNNTKHRVGNLIEQAFRDM